MQPRLLTPRAARRYLAGQDPEVLGVRPLPIGGELLYDVKVLDAKLDELAGIAAPSAGDDPEALLHSWVASHGAP